MNKRFLGVILVLATILSAPVGLVLAQQVSDTAHAGTQALNRFIAPAPSQLSLQAGISSTMAVTATATATPTPTSFSTRTVGANTTTSPTSTPIPSASATETLVAAPTSTGTPPVLPSATATASTTPAAIDTGTATPTATLSVRPAVTATRSFRFQVILETRRNGVLHATETFSGEKAGDDYRFSAVYKDNEGTVNENDYVVVGGKVYHRSASMVGGEIIGPPIDLAVWREVDAKTYNLLPRELVDGAISGQLSAIRRPGGAGSDAELVDFKSNGRFATGTAHVERQTGRLAQVEARQEFEVAPGIGMVLSATMSLADFDVPVSIAAP